MKLDDSGRGTTCVRIALNEPTRQGQRRKRESPSEGQPQQLLPERTPPSRRSVQLAMAHAIERALDEGKTQNLAEVSRLLNVSRARVTQLVGLLYLPVANQELILARISPPSSIKSSMP